jgi:hypothetical protein
MRRPALKQSSLGCNDGDEPFQVLSEEGAPMSSLLRRDFLTRAAAFAAATTATLAGTRLMETLRPDF